MPIDVIKKSLLDNVSDISKLQESPMLFIRAGATHSVTVKAADGTDTEPTDPPDGTDPNTDPIDGTNG